MSVASLLAELTEAKALLKNALVQRGYEVPKTLRNDTTVSRHAKASRIGYLPPVLSHYSPVKKLRRQKDLREKRTLRSKVFRILEKVGPECHRHQHKITRIMNCEKRKLKGNSWLWQTNDNQASIDCSQPSPREVLRRSLSSREFAILSDDPMYFVVNSRYKHKLKSLIERSWDDLLAQDSKTENKKRQRLPQIREL